MHADHTMGLPGFIASMNLLGRKAPLDIYGPAELEEFVKKVWYLTGTHIEFKVISRSILQRKLKAFMSVIHLKYTHSQQSTEFQLVGLEYLKNQGAFSLRPHSKKKFKLNHLEIQKLKKGRGLRKMAELQ